MCWGHQRSTFAVQSISPEILRSYSNWTGSSVYTHNATVWPDQHGDVPMFFRHAANTTTSNSIVSFPLLEVRADLTAGSPREINVMV